MDTPPPHRVKDALDPARAAAMAATLGRPPPGAALPRFWHHAHFWEAHPPEALGRDGHPRPGLPPIPETHLPRRMWAGGALEWHGPLRLGVPAEKATRVLSLDRKTGRSGPFALLRLEHVISQDGTPRVTEWQHLVYLPDPDDRPVPPPPTAPDGTVVATIPTDPVTLFRYSALTFNGHRIHYDAAYATRVEGHGGLVVHGPLLAEALIHAAGAPAAFRYRATAPLLAGERGEVLRDGRRLWVRGPGERLCMEGEVLDAPLH